MGNVLSNLMIASAVAGFDITTNQEAAIAFQHIQNVQFYNTQVKSTINVGQPTPRIVLDETQPLYDYCENTFHLCSALFDNYDDHLNRFLGKALVKTATKPTSSRNRRVVITGTAILALIIGSFVAGGVIGGAVTHKNNEKTSKRMEIMESQIQLLNQQTELNTENFVSITDMLQKNENLVLNGQLGVPMEVNFQQALLKEKKAEWRDLFHIDRMNDIAYRKLTQHSLTLENNRLPLDSAFLLALRAHCLAQQIDKSSTGDNFCKEFAFYSTRWDTSFDFKGLAFEYNEEGKFKSTIYSFSVLIPVLEPTRLKLFQIFNMGKYVARNQIKRTEMPENAVQTQNMLLHPITLQMCQKIGGNFFCPPHAITAYNDCLNAIFLGDSSPTCIVTTSPTQSTCSALIQQDFIVISMFEESKIFYNVAKNRHLHKTEPVGAFAVVKRSIIPGQIRCEKTMNSNDFSIISVPALPVEITQNITIQVSQGTTLEIHSLHSNAIEKIGKTANETLRIFDD